jgi:putative transposase
MRDRRAIAAALKTIYRAKDAAMGRQALDEFGAGPWGKKYPVIPQSWRRNWEHVIPLFAFSVAVRRIIYTTNAIEVLNAKLRCAVRRRGLFPRRSRDEIALSRLAPGYGKMKNAATRMVRGEDPIGQY